MKKVFDLKLGFSCNNDCIHCVVADKRKTKDYTTQEVKDIIDSLQGDYLVGFTGGEPTIRRDFIELVKYAKEKGFETSVQTNGTMFGYESFTKEIAPYIDNVLIAIHSHDPDIHNEIVKCHPKQNMFQRTIDGLKNLVKYNIDHGTQTVISWLNIKGLKETYDLIQSISPGTYMNMTYPHLYGNAWDNHEIVAPRYSDIKPYLHKALEAYAPLLRTEAIPLCYLYPYQNAVDENTDENIINGLRQGTEGIDPGNKGDDKGFFDENGRTENYAAADLSEKRKAPLCRQCVFTNRCPGVWKEYIYFYKNRLDLYPIVK